MLPVTVGLKRVSDDMQWATTARGGTPARLMAEPVVLSEPGLVNGVGATP